MRRNIVTWSRSVGKRPSELFVNEPAPPPVGRIDYGEYDTFISHKGDDINLAEQVGDALYEEGLTGYLDKWDPKVDGDSPELEIHIRQVIRETPSILAVVTEHTPMSWWVPFELGVARETGSQVATLLGIDEQDSRTVSLPSYLRNWPIIASQVELKQWARTLAASRHLPKQDRATLLEKSSQMSADSYGLNRVNRLVNAGKVRFVG